MDGSLPTALTVRGGIAEAGGNNSPAVQLTLAPPRRHRIAPSLSSKIQSENEKMADDWFAKFGAESDSEESERGNNLCVRSLR